jgi:transcriptional regulator with XRE-family HTH domain
MGEQDAFGPNLRRLRVQRGISLESIAGATKVSTELWAGLERNDFSRWPAGIFARAYVRAYASHIGADPDATVDEFCRLFPHGDRRALRVVREQAALIGHNLRWRDDLVGSVTDEKRASASSLIDFPVIASTRTGRVAAAALDIGAVIGLAAVMTAVVQVRWSVSLAVTALTYHAVSLVALGSTPVVWALDTYLRNQHPSASRAAGVRFVRLWNRSETGQS